MAKTKKEKAVELAYERIGALIAGVLFGVNAGKIGILSKGVEVLSTGMVGTFAFGISILGVIGYILYFIAAHKGYVD